MSQNPEPQTKEPDKTPPSEIKMEPGQEWAWGVLDKWIQFKYNTRNKIKKLLGALSPQQYVSKTMSWVRAKVRNCLGDLGWIKKAKPVEETAVAPPVNEETEVEPEQESEESAAAQSEEVKQVDWPPAAVILLAQADQLTATKMEAMCSDFAEISKVVAPAPLERDPELDNLAKQRVADMKKKGKLDHDEAFCTSHHCSENILSKPFRSAGEAARHLMNSEDHRKNMLGSYQKIGVAMDVVQDKKSGSTLYYLAVIYKDGQPTAQVPDEKDIPAEPNTAKQHDPLPVYLKAIQKADLSFEKNDLLTEKLAQDAKARGAYVVICKNAAGKQVTYRIYPDPPHVLREDTSKRMTFRDILQDFQEASGNAPVEKEGKVMKMS